LEKHYISADGMNKLQEELRQWKMVKRPAMVRQVQTAREHGDLSENAEYHAAKEELSRIDAKIHRLQATLDASVLIDSSSVNTDQVRLLTRVKVRDETNQRNREFTIVSVAEADPAGGKISHNSPVGKGLMGRRAGETVEITIPAGTVKWTILEILPV